MYAAGPSQCEIEILLGLSPNPHLDQPCHSPPHSSYVPGTLSFSLFLDCAMFSHGFALGGSLCVEGPCFFPNSPSVCLLYPMTWPSSAHTSTAVQSRDRALFIAVSRCLAENSFQHWLNQWLNKQQLLPDSATISPPHLCAA